MAEAGDTENEIKAFTREIDKAKKMRRALVKLKHRLETKLKIPCSATFKEYESFGKVDLLKNNYTNVKLASCRAKLELCLIACGIKCVDIKNGEMLFELCLSVGPRIFSGYQIQIDEVESEGFHLVKYNLPYGLDVKTIIQKVPMKDTNDMLNFLKFIRACSCALLHRRNQVEELKKYCSNNDVDIDVFTSSDATFIDISFQSDILMLTSKTEKITFILRYGIDTYLPIDTEYEKKHLNKDDKSHLDSCFSDFLTLSLVEAFRCIRHVKRQPQESMSKQLRQETLHFRAITMDSKHREDQTSHQGTQEQNVVESKSLQTSEIISRHTSVHALKVSKDNVESRPEISSPRHISTHKQNVQQFSNSDVESMPETTSPRRVSTRTQKMSEEEVEFSTKTASSRRTTTRTRKMPEEKVESRAKTASPRHRSIHVQNFSDDELMPKRTSPRRISTRTPKMPEEEVESRAKTASPRRRSIRVQNFSEDESMPERTSPRRISTRTQKIPEEKFESKAKTTSPRHRSIRVQNVSDDSMPESTSRLIATRTQKMLEEKAESRVKTASLRHRSIHIQNFSDDKSIQESTSPRHITHSQKAPEEKIESRTKNASRQTLEDKMLSEEDGVELRLQSPSKQVPIHTQQIPKKNPVVVLNPMVRIPRSALEALKINRHDRLFQKSSTPLRMGNTAHQQQLDDADIDDLSTIIGSDTNVQSLSEESRSGDPDPVAASTPFVQSNTRHKRTVFTEKKQNIDNLQTISPQVHSHKYRQTHLHNFITNQHAQEINKSVRTSPRKKSLPEQYSSQSDRDDEKDRREKEKKRKSGVNVHKSTPVPKGFQSKRVKKSVTQHSVVTGKRLRKKN